MRNGPANNGGAIPIKGGPRSLARRTGGAERMDILPAAERLLERLHKVKQTRPDRWQARCPAHDDRSPSLSLTETTDGRILIKCWAGCSAQSIVEAVGLKLADLFPKTGDYLPSHVPRYSAQDIVETIVFESTVLEVGYRKIERGEWLSDQDAERVNLAIQTIQNCKEVVR